MIQNRIYLDPATHTYYDREGTMKPISCSKFLEKFFPEFDRMKISAACAGKGKYAGMTQKEVLAQWDGSMVESQDHGNYIHNGLEHFGKNFTIKPGCEEIEPMIRSVFADYVEYHTRYSEEVLYTKFGIAGTCDKLFFVSSSANSAFDLEDFKTNLKKGIEFCPDAKVKEKFCKYPIEHLSNCNYTKYALQLSMYAYMVEELTGRKCRKLTIRFIPPDDPMQHVKIAVPYMKHEIHAMIHHWISNPVKTPVQIIKQMKETYEQPQF